MKVVNGNLVNRVAGSEGEKEGKSVFELQLFGDVGDDWDGITLDDVARQLSYMGDATEIDVFLNTRGGSISEGVAIYNLLKLCSAKINMYVVGMAYSIGSVILLAGDKRVLCTGAQAMIHPGAIAGWVHADKKKLRDYANMLEQYEDAILDIYVNRTGSEREPLRELLEAETYMSAEQALELGFVTELSEETPVSAENMVKFEVENIEDVPMAARAHFVAMESVQEGGDALNMNDLTIENLQKERPDLVEKINANAGEEHEKAIEDAVAAALASVNEANEKHLSWLGKADDETVKQNVLGGEEYSAEMVEKYSQQHEVRKLAASREDDFQPIGGDHGHDGGGENGGDGKSVSALAFEACEKANLV